MPEALVTMLLAAHLLCVNVASTGPLVCLWLDHRAGRGDEAARWANRYLSLKSWGAFLAAGALGVTIAWLLWGDAYRALLQQFAYKVRWGICELIFSGVLMTVHAAWTWRVPVAKLSTRILRGTLAFLAATNLLYHFPVLFVVIAEVRVGHLQLSGPVSAAAFRELVFQGDVLARTAHVILASFAVTGVTLVGYARWLGPKYAGADRIAVWGARLALPTTALQLVAGLWLMAAVPADMQQRFLGGDWIASGLLGLSVVLALSLLHPLATISSGETTGRAPSLAIVLMLLVVLLMTAALHRAEPPTSREPASITAIEIWEETPWRHKS